MYSKVGLFLFYWYSIPLLKIHISYLKTFIPFFFISASFIIVI